MIPALEPDTLPEVEAAPTRRQITYTQTPVLRPGLDLHNGVVYMTVPAEGPREVKVGKKTVEKIVEFTAGVTSNRDEFVFDYEGLKELGFAMPVVAQRPESRWSPASIDAFLDGRAQMPDPAALYLALKEVYAEHIEFSNELYEDVMALYVMSSYVFTIFESIGYIHFNGTAASGKSQNLRILKSLGFNTHWTGSMTSSTLFRTVAGDPGLVCVDEAEDFSTEKGAELRTILNAGYKTGSVVKRSEKEGETFVVKNYNTFGPKVIASIAPLDYVLGSRSIVMPMRPAIREIPEFHESDARWSKMRDQLYLFAMFHTEALAALAREWDTKRLTQAPNLRHRQWEVGGCLVVLAAYVDPTGELAKTIIVLLDEYFIEAQKKQDADDRMRLLLLSLPEVLRTKAPYDGDWYAIKDIHEVVCQLLDTDQIDYYKTRHVSRNLDVLGFKTKRAHKNGSQIRLTAEAVRSTLLERRVTPTEESDLAWLRGERDLETVITHLPSTPTAASVWDSMAAAGDMDTN